MADEQFCLFWIDHWLTCLTKEQWAVWVQAVGGTLALLIAIAVPWGIRRHELQVAKEADMARAHIIAASLLVEMKRTIGCLEATMGWVKDFMENGAALNLSVIQHQLDGLRLPLESDLLAIQTVDTKLALTLTRCTRIVWQINEAIKLVNAHKSSQPKLISELIPYWQSALHGFKESTEKLDAFITEREGAADSGE